MARSEGRRSLSGEVLVFAGGGEVLLQERRGGVAPRPGLGLPLVG